MIETIEHTADIRLRITAPTREDLFREAVRGTIALLRPEKGERKVQREVAVDAVDPTVLLIDLLNQAIAFGADVKAVTYHEAEIRQNANGEWSTVIVYDI